MGSYSSGPGGRGSYCVVFRICLGDWLREGDVMRTPPSSVRVWLAFKTLAGSV